MVGWAGLRGIEDSFETPQQGAAQSETFEPAMVSCGA